MTSGSWRWFARQWGSSGTSRQSFCTQPRSHNLWWGSQRKTEDKSRNLRTMEREVSMRRKERCPLSPQSVSSNGQSCPLKNPPPLSQQPNCRTSWSMENPKGGTKRLLVASNKAVYCWICQRMHNLSAKQNYHPSKSTIATTHSPRRNDNPLFHTLHGLHYKATWIKREWHHPYSHRPRMYQGGDPTAL